MQEKDRRAVIMAGADITDYSFYTPLSGDYVICADRGYLHARKLGVTPAVLLGDFDSLGEPVPENVKVLQFPAEKDETDLQIAIRHAVDAGFKKIYGIGTQGGRTDHFLANIGLLQRARLWGCEMILEDCDSRIRLLHGSLTLPRRKNFYLSVIPFPGDAVVSLSGVKYPLSAATLTVGDTLGISNEIISETATVCVHTGAALILECRADREL